MFGGGDEQEMPAGMGGFPGMFSGMGGGRHAGRGRAPQQPKSTTLHMKVQCSLEELFHGFACTSFAARPFLIMMLH